MRLVNDVTVSVVGILLVWVLLGLAGGGFAYSYFLHSYPSVTQPYEARNFALIISIGGPIGLLVAYPASNFGHFGWWCVGHPVHHRDALQRAIEIERQKELEESTRPW